VLPTVGLDHGPELLLAPAEAADRLGCDSVWATDHALMSHARESEYPYQRRRSRMPWSGSPPR
jgi:hypothetical protein